MSNYFEYNDKMAFHPGYYIKEIIDNSGLTQEDFAKRLDTTPKNLSLLIRGEQSLSIDIAMKLSRMLGTDVTYWLNLQKAYDVIIAECKSGEELQTERELFEFLNYQYFCDNFGLSEEVDDTDEQIKRVRQLLQVATLSVLSKPDMTVRFRDKSKRISLENTIKANTLIQLGINKTLTIETPKYNKSFFERTVAYASKLAANYVPDVKLLQELFKEAGVVLVSVPDIAGSNVSGACKKVGNKIMLLCNGEQSVLRETENILKGDFGVTFAD